MHIVFRFSFILSLPGLNGIDIKYRFPNFRQFREAEGEGENNETTSLPTAYRVATLAEADKHVVA